MNDFPEFMRHPYNKIYAKSVSGAGVEGYVFDGADGGQMTIWTCELDGTSPEHVHDFDEYLVVVQGQYTLIMGHRSGPQRGSVHETLWDDDQAQAGED